MHRTTLAAVCAALLVVAAPVAAQETMPAASSTKGFFLGAHLGSSAITLDDLDDANDSGAGIGLQAGYGFTPKIAVFLDATGARLNTDGGDLGLGHFDVGVRYAFTSPTRRFAPSLEIAYSGRALAQDDADLGDGSTGDLSFSGTGLTFGGGLQYYVSPKLAIGAGLKWTTGEFSTMKLDDVSVDGLDIDATSTRLNLGVTWYPMGGR